MLLFKALQRAAHVLAAGFAAMTNTTVVPTKGKQHGRMLYVVSLILFTIGRLYLLRGEDIMTYNSGYDDSLFVDLGEHAFWGRPPDDVSLVRLPVYPLWIWLCHQTGVPLYFGTNIAAIAAYAFLAYALHRLGLPRYACAAIYVGLLFEITGIDTLRRVIASNLYGILFIVTIACMALVFAATHRRERWIASGGSALAISLFALTRAESVLAWMLLGLFLVAFALRELWATTDERLLQRLAPAGLPVVALMIAPLVVATINYKAYGVFTSCSLTSRNFSSAINSLLAIQPDKDIPYVSVTKNARTKAYKVSPAMKQLEPFLEGPPGSRWGRHAAIRYGVSAQEIGGGWFFFALRGAVASKTQTLAESNCYYWRISQELQKAFKAGKLPRRHVWLSLVQPDPTIWQRFPSAFGNILNHTLRPYPPVNMLGVARPTDSIPAIEDRFDRVTYRRSFAASANLVVAGWGFSNGQPVVSVLATKGNQKPASVAFQNFVRPGVFNANREQFPTLNPQLPLGFSAAITLPSRKRTGGGIQFLFGDGTHLAVGAATLLPQRFTLGSNPAQPTGYLRVEKVADSQENRPDLALGALEMSVVGKVYSVIFILLLVTSVPSLLLLALLQKSAAHNRSLSLWLVPVLGFAVARTTLLALIDASSFYGSAANYVVTVAEALVIVAIVLNTQAFVIIRARFQRPHLVEEDVNPRLTAV